MVEFKGVFDGEVTKSLNNRAFKKLWWLVAVICLVVIVIGVLGVVFPEDDSDVYSGIGAICFGALFPIIWIILSRFVQKRLDKTMSIMSPDTSETYQFYPDKIIIKTRKGEEYEATVTAKYSYLYKVEETPDTYFLLISKAQSHVVKKCNLTQGSIEELNSILSSNLGVKFKAQNK